MKRLSAKRAFLIALCLFAVDIVLAIIFRDNLPKTVQNIGGVIILACALFIIIGVVKLIVAAIFEIRYRIGFRNYRRKQKSEPDIIEPNIDYSKHDRDRRSFDPEAVFALSDDEAEEFEDMFL